MQYDIQLSLLKAAVQLRKPNDSQRSSEYKTICHKQIIFGYTDKNVFWLLTT